MVRIIFIYWWR